MKTLKLTIVILFLAVFAGKTEAHAPLTSVSFGIFYDELYNYGSWIELNDGLVVWQPGFVGFDWSPYSRGNWLYTSQGWYWDSHEPFGRVVYHYGRWYFDDYYGWIWIPDYEWAPAWVDWRYDDDYIGWAPLPPYASFSVSVGLRFTSHYSLHFSRWNFVSVNYFYSPYSYNYYVPSHRKFRIYSRTKVRTHYAYRNNAVYNQGVDPRHIERRGRTSVRERELVFRDRQGDVRGDDRTRVEVYRPDRDQNRQINRDTYRVERADRSTSLNTGRIEIGERSTNIRTERVDRNATRAENDRKRLDENSRTERNTDVNRVDRSNDDRGTVRDRTGDRTDRDGNRDVNRDSRTDTRGNVERERSDRNRNDRGTDAGVDRRTDTRTEPRVERRTETRTEPRVERRTETRTEPRVERRTETRTEPRVERRTETRTEPRVERRTESRVERREPSRDNSQRSGSDRGRSDSGSRDRNSGRTR